MPRTIGIVWSIFFVLFLSLLSGCSGTGGSPGGGDIAYGDDEDKNAPRYFVFGDTFDKDSSDKRDCFIADKPPNVPHTLYIYVINNGGQWKNNDVRNIAVTYYDNTRPGVTVPQSDIHILKDGKHNDQTYIRVDNVIYPHDARGYFLIEGEIFQGNKWYSKRVSSNLFNYGDPDKVKPPLNKNNIIYEKEVVE